MPKTLYIHPDYSDRSGIDVTYYKTKKMIRIGGWYDTFVGIEGMDLTLREFFDELGITEKDCQKVFREGTNNANRD